MDPAGLIVVAAVLVIGTAAGWWWRRAQGRFEVVGADLRAEFGLEPADATLLQFSSQLCAPCRAVHRISTEAVAQFPGVRHVEVDAAGHLDAVRALKVWRTPTLLILDARGRVVRRASGVPSTPELLAVLADLVPRR